ncbi:uncharacterized protein CCOS01_11665 [Colletotrichum costaricense]|uniref:Uncharacterized protein n=2 Tax=Colletotrichum acutatum species complex TaxID=2707335 RepID=A0AAI9YPG3_9PEZI|nr:uncharacterized protein CCOS01_11665 [Colletotrichum costaricense]XP_060383017.1 uncharacterized protein CTAM01_06262 [Colletotrichum tamarilloi]KAK1500810.1 hypothetical protein CTAM01_06262 [Colletotrichum tamarilloi]KAK1518845.1 hypothetical protein CCOS01_11665 [Colletotrichum costaricense]
MDCRLSILCVLVSRQNPSLPVGKDPTFLSISFPRTTETQSFQNRESQDSKKRHSPFKRTPNLTRTPCSCTSWNTTRVTPANIVSADLNSYFTNVVYPYLHPLRDPGLH